MFAKKTAALMAAGIFTFSLVSCAPRAQRHETSLLTLFDTVTYIIGYADTESEFEKNAEFICGELREYHELYDIYNDYDGINNLKTVNDNAGIAPVVVDEKIIDLLLYAKEAYEITDGCVNVAMGSVLSIWHDYRAEGIDDPQNAVLPPMELLREAALHTDISMVCIDEENSTVFLADPLMKLDVGALAKGYAAQCVCDAVREKGIEGYLISVGGNVCAVGAKGDGSAWTVGLQSPYDVSTNIHTITLNGLCVVTSGNYQRFYTVAGREYNHIIAPSTLMPAENFDAVTIVCADSGLADALSTALFIMSYEDGRRLVESLDGVEAAWFVAPGDEIMTDGFKQMLKQ